MPRPAVAVYLFRNFQHSLTTDILSDAMTTPLRAGDRTYPALLATVPSPPPLYVLGTVTPEDSLAVAIVGSRRATPYGLEVAESLAAELAIRGVTIVSGLARGVDTAAHRGALSASGRTLAVLGSGIDVIYPRENRRLAAEIAREGAVVSQFPRGTTPRPWHFPLRNRTLAGLALGVVVVEADERSGALITAGLAGDLGREVFAVPGKITSAMSVGPHRLIQDGAKLVRNWADVVQELPEHWRRAVRAPSTCPHASSPPSERTMAGRVLSLLTTGEPRQIDELIGEGVGASQVAAALMDLEIGGWVRQLPGQRWVAAPGTAGAAAAVTR
jgi:DNA processing protein